MHNFRAPSTICGIISTRRSPPTAQEAASRAFFTSSRSIIDFGQRSIMLETRTSSFPTRKRLICIVEDS
jgi:hypothetical protein